MPSTGVFNLTLLRESSSSFKDFRERLYRFLLFCRLLKLIVPWLNWNLSGIVKWLLDTLTPNI